MTRFHEGQNICPRITYLIKNIGRLAATKLAMCRNTAMVLPMPNYNCVHINEVVNSYV